jgi:hypothetical protein
MDYEHGNVDWIGIARSFVTSVGDGRTDDALRLLTPDVTGRVHGHHSLSGTFSGREDVAKHFAAMMAQTDGRIDPVKFDDWMLGLRHISVLVDIHVEVGGAAELLRHLILMRFNVDDLIEELTIFFWDPDAAERLYGDRLREGPKRREAEA